MFTAYRESGSPISLYSKRWSREELELERSRTTFFCGACKGRLILKLGNTQAWHFAHHPDSVCTHNTRRETDVHIKGKLLLMRWLHKHGYHPMEEHYIKEIKQRPDILVQMKDKMIAFELQRSSLSSEVFMKRQSSYLTAGIETVWAGLPPPQMKFYGVIPSRQLDNLLIRDLPFKHSIYLDIQHERWLLLTDFMYLSPKKVFVMPHFISLSKPPACIVNLNDNTSHLPKYLDIYLGLWTKQIRKKRLHIYPSYTPVEKRMYRIFQQHRLNLNYFPAVAALPLKSNFNFFTAPYWWQSWIILTIINGKPLNSVVRLSETAELLYQEVKSGCFHTRPFGVHPKEKTRESAGEFLEALTLFGAVVQTHPGVYKIKRHINLNKQLDTLCNDDEYVLNKIKERLCKNKVW
ncbi:competence protein CoiA [Evansella clarkii]|uniref:competence protein CoiA n=1 Tax=Evansella clarkii TaxID=79879 RepID=UPI000997CEB4|nr:competence protein CoiA family protein [Evansella clarkii]